MRYLSIDGLRTEQWECAVRDKNLANVHMKSDWCAGYKMPPKPGSLFNAVRLYLECLCDETRGPVLTDETSDSERIDHIYVLYAYLIWETNGMQGLSVNGKKVVGGVRSCPKSLAWPGTWRSVVVDEIFSSTLMYRMRL